MLNWIAYRKQPFARIAEIARLAPDTVKGYQMISSAGRNNDVLGAKTRELISLAVAVSLRCDGCITVHTAEALKQGATRDEIAEALGVAVAVNAGAAMVYSARTMDAVAAHSGEASA
ncbi:carboxymuconolactone decarboxylase family protein [Paraburkholderia strydomiana]|uniref:carboxymuconolactone decarboxylase family protein n=1 Tax=Paraburkholderia strydomiana TaxID=1245417 RepID=UPI001BEB9393|nr:carboxymuconolactone decarboxylase family protein [Paraburkholderia strydomiana]MBT2790082.1 carboxymuconolactone decarboxylase family protein [Paraburkholderia strydomiana]